jgi:hypothetical protein
MRSIQFLLLVLAFAAAPGGAAAKIPQFGHVFIIVLENENYVNSFGAKSEAPYLARTLPKKGALLTRYFGIGHYSLDNYLAMISGQAPNPVTQADCETFSEFTLRGITPDGQAIGEGCVYPTEVRTLSDQMNEAGLRWKGYMEDMGNDPNREAPRCGHPAIGQSDDTQIATPQDQYATRHNPFVYFHSIIDRPDCQDKVVRLEGLSADLASLDATLNLVFVTPNLCHDGHDLQCADGASGGLPAIDRFLRVWVPKITASPAYQKDGLLIITFDEADSDPQSGDAAACCHEQAGPNEGGNLSVDGHLITGPGIAGAGGGRVGAVFLSPAIKPGTVSNRDYNHYSLLRSLEDNFGLAHLGYAGQPGLRAFGKDIFTDLPVHSR